ncbi:hypothetical protein VAMP_178845n270 [Candidatus Vampirococcus lugosii]|uniref:DUF4349 domain-containing protein n=2 Tax=Candidatus Vampirococcus lugosii TaxID=2789015 RepID=A0ABS5QN00_9BACT|nr:hypothetical protein [Candidatus Vampirococcus lugosii]
MKKFFYAFRNFFSIFWGILSYLFFVYYFFYMEYWLMGTVFLLLFFLSMPYFFISLRNYGTNYLVGIFLISAFLISFIIGYDDLFKIISLFVFHIGISFFLLKLDSEVNNRKLLSSFSIFTAGTGIFSLFVSLTYASGFLAKYDEFNMTCDDIGEYIDSFLGMVLSPFEVTVNEANNIKNYTSSFYEKSFGELIGISNLSSIEQLTGDLQNINNLTGNLQNLTGEIQNLSGDLQNINTEIIQDQNYNSGILGKVESWKNKLVDNVMKDKEIVDQGVCEVFIEQIDKRYEEPGFKFSVILSLFLLLWPSFRLFIFIFSLINFLFFKFLNLIKVYSFFVRTDEVEDIK